MKSDLQKTLADNINRLIDHWHKSGARSGRSVRGWALAHGLEPKVAQRALGRMSPKLETLEKLGDALGLAPWVLLYPELDPMRPPVAREYSREARDLARVVDDIADPVQKQRAYALAIQVAEMGLSPPPALSTGDVELPGVSEPPAPSSVPTPERARHR